MKKLILSILVAVILFVSILTPLTVRVAQAGPWYDQSFNEWYEKVYNPNTATEIFGERYTAAQVQWILYSLKAFFFKPVGYDFMTCAQALDVGQCIAGITDASIYQDTMLTEKQPGIIEGIFAEKPLSGITYLKDVGRKFHLVSEAQAQGYGFGAFEPIQHMWKAVRNIEYSLFIIVIIVMAFMIMFRVKISPQTVITVQSALPKIIMALILVTFSYAIAGFLVDLMYVVIGILSIIAVQFHGEFFMNFSAGTIFNVMTKGPTIVIPTGIVGMMLVYLITFIISIVIVVFFETGIIGIIAIYIAGSGLVGLGGPALTALLGMVALIAIIWIVILAIKITFMLIKAFTMVILLTIFAPFYIGFGPIVPFLGFGNWVRSFLTNLAVFPVVGFFFVMAGAFLYQAISIAMAEFTQGRMDLLTWAGRTLFGTQVGGLEILTPTSEFPPLLGGGLYALLFIGVSATIFLLIPKIADLIKSLISGRPFAYGTAISEAFMGGKYYTGYAAGRVQGQQLPIPTALIPQRYRDIFQGAEYTDLRTKAKTISEHAKERRW
ncbi:hypothetical protein A2Z22_02880 [Candidatus Woesebacteria bacterium RBG_16_34_12]|uniref:Uncharacterized protein n=1 Tax=Candidatus Woesebacteria bacterium RBG_16_34_12 TaxID=1802480 RepID=A0A1F7X6U6_9BACT|nr:MAG: hypothetical protein A2Z22_02880 [Candidatus Woesebacteria bacterium RBG_16_34_12]